MAAPLPRRRRGWILWVIVLVAGGVGAQQYAARRPKPSLSVRVHRVGRGTVRDLVSSVAAGRVAAEREATVRAEVAGTIVSRRHRRGDHVAAGEALITYDARELEHRAQLATAALMLGRAQAAQARSSSDVALRSSRRAAGLRDQGATAPADAEALEGQAEIAAMASNAARTGLAQAEANVLLARDALAKSVLRAPFAGTVLTALVEQGEITTPAMPLFTIADDSRLHVDADLDESDLGRIALQMPAEIALDAFPGERVTGVVTEIAPSVTRDARGERSVAIRVDVDRDPRIRIGMSADVDVITARRADVLSVPPNAILGRGTDRAVLVVEGEFARRRAITVGISTWEAVEIVRGVSAGDRVITTLSVTDLVDGSRVTVASEDNAPASRAGSGH